MPTGVDGSADPSNHVMPFPRFEPYTLSRPNHPGSPIYRPELAITDNRYIPLHIPATRTVVDSPTPDPVMAGFPIPDPIRALEAMTEHVADLAAESAIRAISIDANEQHRDPELVRRPSDAASTSAPINVAHVDNDLLQPLVYPRREMPVMPSVDLLAMNSLLAITTGHVATPDQTAW